MHNIKIVNKLNRIDRFQIDCSVGQIPQPFLVWILVLGKSLIDFPGKAIDIFSGDCFQNWISFIFILFIIDLFIFYLYLHFIDSFHLLCICLSWHIQEYTLIIIKCIIIIILFDVKKRYSRAVGNFHNLFLVGILVPIIIFILPKRVRQIILLLERIIWS